MEATALDSSAREEEERMLMGEEERIVIVRRHFERKGYRVHSGLQFGCELVLYADIPQRVHSDFCVHVVPPGKCEHAVFRLRDNFIQYVVAPE